MIWAAWFDMSPMRPDEWARTDVGRWTYFMQIRRAYDEAHAEVIRYHKDMDDRKRAADERNKWWAGR